MARWDSGGPISKGVKNLRDYWGVFNRGPSIKLAEGVHCGLKGASFVFLKNGAGNKCL